MTFKELREGKGISQTELANRVGLKQTTISQYENGSRRPNLPIAKKLSVALGISLDDFVSLFAFGNEVPEIVGDGMGPGGRKDGHEKDAGKSGGNGRDNPQFEALGKEKHVREVQWMGALLDAPGILGAATITYVTVKDVMWLLGCRENKAYTAIREINQIAKEEGQFAYGQGKASKYIFSDKFRIPMEVVDAVIEKNRE